METSLASARDELVFDFDHRRGRDFFIGQLAHTSACYMYM